MVDVVGQGNFNYFVYLLFNNPGTVSMTTAPGIGPLVLVDPTRQLGATANVPNEANQP